MNIIPTLLGFIPRKPIVIIIVSAMLPLQLLVLIATSQLAAATPYSDGYSHGCDDGKVGYHKYLDTPGKEIDFHTTKFIQGYDAGYKACFSPNGTGGSGNKAYSAQLETRDTLVSCNKTEHTVEYCSGYHAGAVQSDVDDDPDDNTMPSKVICQDGSPGSEYCSGYQQGYADEDHASAH
jgi:hypothetical protein